MVQSLNFYGMIQLYSMIFNGTKFEFLWYGMAYPNDFYNRTKIALLLCDPVYPNDFYNGAKFVFTWYNMAHK